MRENSNKKVSWLFVLMTLFTLVVNAGNQYELRQSQVVTGGGQAQGGSYQLISAVGQKIIGRSSGGVFELDLGFITENRDLIFINEFE